MSFWQVIILVVWGIIGLFRYIECEDSEGNSVEPDLRGYTWYTVLVNGPFWWLVKLGVFVMDMFGKVDWSWLEHIFRIEKKEKK